MTTQPSDFYSDLKWCDACQDYRRYLMSMEHSYCVDCGCKVRLFNNQDWAQFNETIKERKPKGGRPRKKSHEAEPA
jgi:predicted transcriptional regulator